MSEFLKTFDKLNDAQLRSSVKLLGKLLGNIIKSHAGDKVYIAVEKHRKHSNLVVKSSELPEILLDSRFQHVWICIER